MFPTSMLIYWMPQTFLILSRNKPLCQVSKMVYGNKPADGGYLIIEEKDYPMFVTKEPESLKFIKPLLGATEYLHGKKRYCLWLQGVSPAEIRKCPMVMERIKLCKESRENSIAAGIRKFAETPTLFAQITQPIGSPYIMFLVCPLSGGDMFPSDSWMVTPS